jgi:hypothetical protein
MITVMMMMMMMMIIIIIIVINAGLENSENTAMGSHCADHVTPSIRLWPVGL